MPHGLACDQIIKLLTALKGSPGCPRAAEPIINECIKHMNEVKGLPHDPPQEGE